MLNLSDRIIPGRSAAGVLIGSNVRQLLEEARPVATEERSGMVVHVFPSVKIWSIDGVVSQIGVYAGYEGLLDEKIGLSSTIAEVEKHFGRLVVADEDDNLIITGSPGWCFETEAWVGDTIDSNRNARVTAIFVFQVRNQ